MTTTQCVPRGRRPSVDPQHEDLCIPEWQPLRMRLDHAALRRHVLVLGETGSGKTASVLMPLLRAVLDTSSKDGKRDRAHSALVIDPKDGELTRFLVERLPPERLRLIAPGRGEWTVPFFLPNPSGELPDPHDLFDALLSANPSNPTGGTKDSGFWIASGRRLLEGFISADHWLARTSGPAQVLATWETLLENQPTLAPVNQKQRVVADDGMECLIDGWESRVDGRAVRDLWDRGGYLDLLALGVARTLSNGSFLRNWSALQADQGCPPALWSATAGLSNIHRETLGGIALTAQNILQPFTLSATAGHLWTNPFHRPTDRTMINPTALMNSGAVAIYCPPDPSRRSNVLGQAIKRNFFRAALKTRDRSRPFLYMADEFQRFITADVASGETTFFDRCRAYGVCCVVATQSQSSLRYALESNSAGISADSALQVMLSNLATQFYFRTTDPKTQQRLRSLIPQHPVEPGLPHVIDLRPVTSLIPGEAYWLAASGAWGRGRVKLQSSEAGESA